MKSKTRPQPDTDDLFANTGEAITNCELEITNDKSLTTEDSKHSKSSIRDSDSVIEKKISNSQFVISNSWLGDIPEHWKVMPIKRIVSIPVTDGPHSTPEILDEGIPFISAEAVGNNKIDFSKKRGFISFENHRQYCQKYIPQRDDIYMIKSGATTGNLGIVETDEEFNIWSPLAVIRADLKKALPRYLLSVMNSKEFQTSVQLFWSFGTQQNIGMNVIENLSIPLPPLPEQKAIAEYLDRKTGRIDSLISKKEKLVELLKEKRSALISSAVAGKLVKSRKLKPSGFEWLGDIPEHWEVKKLKHLGKFIAGYAFKSEDFIDSGTRVIKITNIETMKLNWEDESFLPIEYLREYESFSAGNGDFLFALTRPIISSGLKAAFIEDCSQRVLVNQRNAVFHPNLLVNKRFIYFTAFSTQFLASFSSKLDATG
ncbi:MAG: restriction endonuclease subunit S, partial [Victivallales bacterium]